MVKNFLILMLILAIYLLAIFYLIKSDFSKFLSAQILNFSENKKKFENEISNLKEQILPLYEKLNESLKELEKIAKELKESENFKNEIEKSNAKLEKNKNNKEESKKEEIKLCENLDQAPKKEVIFNEICWMGDENSPTNEWIELKNISEKEIDLKGWQIFNKNQKIKIVFEEGTKISPKEILLLERGDDFSGSIKNSNEALFLFDKECHLQDKVEANPNWPAGNNKTKQTAERKENLSWQTSKNPGGTPGKENSEGEKIENPEEEKEEKKEPKIFLEISSQIFSQKEFEVFLSVENLNDATYDVKISILKISDESEQKKTISEISLTGEEWQNSYNYLTKVFSGTSFSGKFKLRINQEFSGQAEIIAKIRENSNKKIVAEFIKKIFIEKSKSTTPLQKSSSEKISSDNQSFTRESSTSTFSKILINEIQIAGEKPSYDFIELYNPNDFPIDISGYQLKKKNKSGTESSLGKFPQGSVIPPRGFFLWACSADGYDQIIGADISFKSYYLTEDNSVALFDKNGTLIDAVAWGSGHLDLFVENQPFPQNPSKNQSLERINFQDTDDNSKDFIIQTVPSPQNSKFNF